MEKKYKIENAKLPLNSIYQKEALLLTSVLALHNILVDYEYVNSNMGIWEDGETDIDPFAVEFYINCGKRGLEAFKEHLEARGIPFEWDALENLDNEVERDRTYDMGVSGSYRWREGKQHTVVALRLEGAFDPNMLHYMD